MFALIVLCLMFANVFSIPTQMPLEESIPTESNITSILVTMSSLIDSHHQNLNFDFYPTLHSAIMGPFSLFSRLFEDMLKFYENRSLFQMFSISSLRSVVMSAPKQVMQFWSDLMAMELECIYRTICDLSAFFSPRIPYWFNQLLGVYFTTHSNNNMYFRAVANGMINHNCINYYPQCSPTAFFNRLASNVSDIISTTISPITLQVMNAINSRSD